ncbi:MAG: TonB-dependent receptor [Flavobacteriaceae bacterium]|nr:TonB-dependent receptor [Flavobacteriaceae bacterium]
MKNFKKLMFVMLLFTATNIFSQINVEGTVKDKTGPLPGATVVEKGTTNGVTTDFDGNFSLQVKEDTGTVLISFVGYKTKSISFNGNSDLGEIVLTQDENVLDEIVVTAVSFAIDRKTPVAVSTIKAEIIEHKLGSQEFPEILKSTPGVYATKSGGGFGDGRLTMRGFNSENVAVMINGVPVNDMENGRVYWSNWAGLSDVTSFMQVQRGLGASKVAVPAIGGTVNILTKTTDIDTGGSIFFGLGNDGYTKYGATVSTGLLDNGLAVTASAFKLEGNGYIDGTQFKGFNYFLNISKQINDDHKISFTSFGAPQRHGQRQNMSLISRYRNAESGNKFNPDWGIKNGQVTNIEDNFYHKSQTSLNHYWNISDKTTLSTALYASFGTGGGGGTAGANRGDLFQVRLGGDDQPVDLDNIVEINRANGEQGLGSEALLRASRNDHSWFGVLSTFKTEITDNFAFVAGLDLRTYTGRHFNEVTDLLGGQYYLDVDGSGNDNNVNNPNAALRVGDKMAYNNDGEVGWQGLFTQLEYNLEKLNVFVAAAVSNTSYKRIDYFNYLDSDPLQETDKYNFTGFSIKGGANYNLNDYHNIFANIGYFEKAASFRSVFPQFDNENINADAENEKIFSVELGYGFRGEKLAGNINIYRTAWNDRALTQTIQNPDRTFNTANILGVNAIHQGIEFDFVYKATDRLTLTGMLSLGDWEWENDVLGVEVFDDEQDLVKTIDLYIAGLKVSESAQTTAALGFDWEIMKKTNFTIDYNYFGNLYAQYDPNDRGTPGPQAWEAPDYSTFDAGLRYNFKIGEFDTTIIGIVNNVFNTEYISDARDGARSVTNTALVWFGFGRTFSVSAKINF